MLSRQSLDTAHNSRVGLFFFAALFIVAVWLSSYASSVWPATVTPPIPDPTVTTTSLRPAADRLIRLAVHFRPGGIDGNRRVESDAFDARLDQLISTNECPKCDLRGAVLQGKNLRETNLSKADLNGARFDRADLSAANLTGAYLFGANFSAADLRGAQLISADLRKANLNQADLRGAYLLMANLRKADLRSAQLAGAFLNGADLTGARLKQADLTNADLTNALVDRSSVDQAILCRTHLPWGKIQRDCD